MTVRRLIRKTKGCHRCCRQKSQRAWLRHCLNRFVLPKHCIASTSRVLPFCRIGSKADHPFIAASLPTMAHPQSCRMRGLAAHADPTPHGPGPIHPIFAADLAARAHLLSRTQPALRRPLLSRPHVQPVHHCNPLRPRLASYPASFRAAIQLRTNLNILYRFRHLCKSRGSSSTRWTNGLLLSQECRGCPLSWQVPFRCQRPFQSHGLPQFPIAKDLLSAYVLATCIRSDSWGLDQRGAEGLQDAA